MTDFQIRSDSVDVEGIMRQIRARIREKRGVDYTEEEIRELARVKLEKFLDPTGVRSDLLQQFRKARAQQTPPPNFAFEDSTIYDTHRALLRWIRKVLRPILKLFFNPGPISDALHIQAEVNQYHAQREELDALHYELIHNLVLETTRLGIEVKNLKMRVESMSSRLDFDERRARALEGVVQYRPGAAAPLQPPASAGAPGDTAEQERRTRRRRRRGRKTGSPREGAFESRAGGEAEQGGSGERRERPPRHFPREASGRPAPAPDRRYDTAGAPARDARGTTQGETSPQPSDSRGDDRAHPAPGRRGEGEGEPAASKPGHEVGPGGESVSPKPREAGGEGEPVPPKPRSGEGE